MREKPFCFCIILHFFQASRAYAFED